MPGMSVSERLTALAKAASFANVSAFARAAGVPEGTMRQHLNRDSIPIAKAQMYVEAARGTEATVDWLLTGKGRPPLQLNGPPVHKTETIGNLPLRERVAVGTLPVWEAVSLPDGRGAASLKINQEPIDFVERPDGLKTAKRALAFRIWDDKMSPAYRRDDTVLMDPARHGIPGSDCAFVHKPVDGIAPDVLVRHLVSETETTWRVEQFRPAKTYVLQKADWPEAWKIHGKYNR